MAARRHLSVQARAKLSARMRGKKHPHKGHRLSAAARAKISARLRGRHPKGHRLSAIARAKISAKLRGRHHPGHRLSATTRAKIAARLKGRHPRHSPHPRRHATRQLRPAVRKAPAGRKHGNGLKARTHRTGTRHPGARRQGVHHPRGSRRNASLKTLQVRYHPRRSTRSIHRRYRRTTVVHRRPHTWRTRRRR
ncbi:NUMOD3 domain-containing DNA-binding protein [Kitasatospora sp. NPDC056731]|uniref:NUMOD3 domain-containing DNA-binding protein n=1 Tax=Kitasatospora sp. NPDC056731 TaxID=3155422 RepID=UPI00342BEC25